METDRASTILIIDDDSTSLLIMEKILQHEGYRTLSSTVGSYAYPLARNKQPDLILLDVNMPGERGPEICKKLKAHPMTSEIPVIFLSVETEVKSKVECFEAGGQDYITKPFESREVMMRIRTHLRLQQTQKTLERVLSSKINDITKAQQVLLPPKPSERPDAKFSVRYQQLSGAGGDFYDVIKAGEDIYDYITADVCGHDLGIAFVTAALKSLFVQNSVPHMTPTEILTTVNKVIPTVLQSGQFVSVSWVRVNRNSNKAFIVNAGQPPVIYIPQKGLSQTIDITGDIIGIFDKVVFEQKEIEISKGDRFLLYSDGIVEIEGRQPQSRIKGIQKLIDCCTTYHDRILNSFMQEIVKNMLKDVIIDDDVVVLGVEV